MHGEHVDSGDGPSVDLVHHEAATLLEQDEVLLRWRGALRQRHLGAAGARPVHESNLHEEPPPATVGTYSHDVATVER